VKPCMLHWAKAFTGARWFHVTGITPALSAVRLRHARGVAGPRAAGCKPASTSTTAINSGPAEPAMDAPIHATVDVLITTRRREKVFGIKARK